MPRIQLSASESEGFKPWPKGDYPFRILKCESKASKNGHPQLQYSLECIEGDYEGKKQTAFVTISEGGGWDLGKFLDACIPAQYEKEELPERDKNGNRQFTYSFDPDDFADTCVLLTNSPEDYKGELTNRWRNPRPYEPLGSTAGRRTQADNSTTQTASGQSAAAEDALAGQAQPQGEAPQGEVQQQQGGRRRLASQ